MEFEYLFNPPSIVQEKKKYANFTVKEIGGPDEILKWRAMQEAKESAYRMRLGAKEERISAFEALTGQKLDSPKVQQAHWEEKLAFALEERKRLAKAEESVTVYPPWESIPEPRQTLFQKVAGFFKRIWNNSNF